MLQPVSPESPPPSRARLLASFGYAWQGIVHVVRTQRNARIHLSIGSLVLVAAAVLRVSPGELAILLLCSATVVAAEMLNTVVEAIVDLITDRYQPLAKVAKDAAAGAVLVLAIASIGVGLLILGPHLWHMLSR